MKPSLQTTKTLDFQEQTYVSHCVSVFILSISKHLLEVSPN